MSAAEQAINNMAAAQAMPRIPPSGVETCPVGRVRIGVFFDGTNNSMYRDRATDAQNPQKGQGNAITNVVKLYDVYQEEGTVLKKIYHHGVGTDSTSGNHGAPEKEYDWMGNAFGAGGKARVEWGLKQLADFFTNNNNYLAKEKQ